MRCRRCNAHDRVVPDQDEKLVLCPPHLWEMAKQLVLESSPAYRAAAMLSNAIDEDLFRAR